MTRAASRRPPPDGVDGATDLAPWPRRAGLRGALTLAACLGTVLAGAAPAPGQWVEAPGDAWTQVALYYQDTREEYGEDGGVRPFFAEGRARTASLFVTSAVGLVRGVDAWIQVPVHHLTFDDLAGSRSRTGLGDVRLFLRAGPRAVSLPATPVTVRAGVKLPGSDFPVDAEIIPLTEGQRDWEVMVEVGHSFHPAPVYAQAWAGYRWREENPEILRDPGDERFAYAAVGGDPGDVSWKLAGQGVWGSPPVVEGVRLPREKRKLLEVIPVLGYRAGSVTLELGGRFPVEGRNFPAGPILRLGAFLRWSLF